MTARWPRSWVGAWRADDGRTVIIERRWGSVLVTVRPHAGAAPASSAPLLSGEVKAVHRLPGLADRGPHGGLRLSVEAGTAGLGPVYHLYPRVRGAAGALTPPTGDEPPSGLVLVPDVTIGMYDEWDDDLGMPWAHPLEPLAWAADVSSGRTDRGR